ncbi:MAG: hypothetical protein WBL88_13450 [Nitrososphaeraceae archaeon]
MAKSSKEISLNNIARSEGERLLDVCAEVIGLKFAKVFHLTFMELPSQITPYYLKAVS